MATVQENNYKDFWKTTELVPSSEPDIQLPILIEYLKKSIDIDKIEKVLEVGVGYGRIAKRLIETFPSLKIYYGIDVSETSLEQSASYLEDYHNIIGSRPLYSYDEGDFEEMEVYGFYDLVISVETMSVVPGYVGGWFSKMCSLSKKYVVNLDFTRGNDTITNLPPKDYKLMYESRVKTGDMVKFKEKNIPHNQSIFIGWIR